MSFVGTDHVADRGLECTVVRRSNFSEVNGLGMQTLVNKKNFEPPAPFI